MCQALGSILTLTEEEWGEKERKKKKVKYSRLAAGEMAETAQDLGQMISPTSPKLTLFSKAEAGRKSDPNATY